MAKSRLISYNTLVAVLFCFLLIASIELQMAEAVGKICSKRSQTWTGICIKTENCDSQCKSWEGAQHGACHRSGFGFACFCYFKC
ncbi:defensin-like protein 1 [Coffea eugenioides]|uniref:Defensin-like protein 1 n=1 Tax=Coffea arabica TaxID=13443 RepID=A0A6P6TPR5_COFAR|nr:defensin-like protein 1 [Coffea arabica]XP_027174815.1 defensin-like protein 1 [Coffea eugenioides]